MNTKRAAFLFVVLIILNCTARAATVNGSLLVEKWRAHKKMQTLISTSSSRDLNYELIMNGAFYTGFVAGVADAICEDDLPDGVTIGQLCEIVGKWLEDNPSRWHEDACILVVRAISSVFPHKAKNNQ